MSEVSQHDTASTSPRIKTDTMASTLDDVMSITSSRIQPAAPHPTPAHTVAGDIPSNDFIARKLLSLELSDNSIERSDTASCSNHVESNQSDMCAEYPEASKWDGVAEEDVMQGLQRLAVVAEDEHKENPSKSVEHYYSLRLAKIIAAGKVKFDVGYLQ